MLSFKLLCAAKKDCGCEDAQFHPVQSDKAWKHTSTYGQILCLNMENKRTASGFQGVLPVFFVEEKLGAYGRN